MPLTFTSSLNSSSKAWSSILLTISSSIDDFSPRDPRIFLHLWISLVSVFKSSFPWALNDSLSNNSLAIKFIDPNGVPSWWAAAAANPSKEDKFCSLDNNSSVTLRALDTSLDSLANLPTYRDKNRIVTNKENQIPIVIIGGFAK